VAEGGVDDGHVIDRDRLSRALFGAAATSLAQVGIDDGEAARGRGLS